MHRTLTFGIVLAGLAAALPAARAADRPGPTQRPAAAAEAERLGWNPAGLAAMVAYAKTLSTDTLLVVTDGRTVAALGDPSRPYNVHSVRKALLSALVGQHVGKGPKRIDLDTTLADLGIDDAPGPLTPPQKQATVRHLIKSVSGINHPAAAEEGQAAEKTRRLGMAENRPGTKWAYNNWDYNVLTTVFETRTGLSVAAAFDRGIARPAGLRDFTPRAVRYARAPRRSMHRAAMFRLSGRDLATFGRIYLNGGTLGGKRILSKDWIDRITTETVDTGMGGLRAGHGYLWWVPARSTGLPGGSYWALGLGQQAVFVIPAWNTVVVHQSDTTEFIRRFVQAIRGGEKPEAALERLVVSCLDRAARKTEFCRKHAFITRRQFERLVSMIVRARR